jgi:hypothetical protein
MSQTDTIREFVVALGYRVDTEGMKKFEEGISKVTASVFRLGKTLATTALAVAGGVEIFASNLEKLYFASQRTGTSATNLRAFDKAAQNFGASADEARASIEGLAHALRINPGNEGLINSLGVQTRDATGHARQLSDVMVDLGKHFAGMPIYLAEQYAQTLGISENTLLAMQQPGFSGELSRQQKLNKGGGYDDASKGAHQFMERFRDFETQVENVATRVQGFLEHKMLGAMNGISDWWNKHGREVSRRISDFADDIEKAAGKAKPALEWLNDQFWKLDKATDGWSTKIAAAAGALKLLGAGGIVTGIIQLSAAILRLGAALVTAGIGGTGATATAAAGAGLIARLLGRLGIAGLLIGGYELYKHGEAGDLTGPTGQFHDSPFGQRLSQMADGPSDENIQGQLTKPRWMGLASPLFTPEQAQGLINHLIDRSGLAPDTDEGGGNYGLAGWGGKSQKEFKDWSSGADLKGSSMDQQIGFLIHQLTEGSEKNIGDLIRAQTNIAQVERILNNQFDPAVSNTTPSPAGAPVMNQENHFHIHGVTDPQANADAVVSKQTKVNSSLTRNLANPVQ